MNLSSARCAGCDRPMEVTRLECRQCGVAMQGEFEVPPLARLSAEDQVFVQAFVQHHGSIKKMERLFGISYPTVKNRLNAISDRLQKSFRAPSSSSIVLERLSKGEINVEEALKQLP